jgi:hypothetical protein
MIGKEVYGPPQKAPRKCPLRRLARRVSGLCIHHRDRALVKQGEISLRWYGTLDVAMEPPGREVTMKFSAAIQNARTAGKFQRHFRADQALRVLSNAVKKRCGGNSGALQRRGRPPPPMDRPLLAQRPMPGASRVPVGCGLRPFGAFCCGVRGAAWRCEAVGRAGARAGAAAGAG